MAGTLCPDPGSAAPVSVAAGLLVLGKKVMVTLDGVPTRYDPGLPAKLTVSVCEVERLAPDVTGMAVEPLPEPFPVSVTLPLLPLQGALYAPPFWAVPLTV